MDFAHGENKGTFVGWQAGRNLTRGNFWRSSLTELDGNRSQRPPGRVNFYREGCVGKRIFTLCTTAGSSGDASVVSNPT